MQVDEPPIAHGRPFTQGEADLLRVGEQQLDLLQERTLRARHLLGGHGRRRGGVERPLKHGARGIDIAAILQLRVRQQHARLAELEREGADARGHLGLDESLVQATRRFVAEDVGQHVDGREVWVRPRGNVVTDHREGRVPSATQHRESLAVLHRFDRVRLVEQVALLERPLRLGNRPEGLLDQLEGLLRLELSGDDEHGVVRLVVLPVERLQPVDRHALDVFLRPDGRAAVAMPQVGRGHHALEQHAERGVLSRLELIAHHRELALEVLLRDEAVHHAIRLELQGPRDVRIRGGHGLEVVRAIVPGAAVRSCAVRGELLRHVLVLGRALEHHVLQQVRHAGLAVAFVTRSDEIRDVDRRRRLRGVGEEEHVQPVGQRVLGDALDARELRGSLAVRRERRRDQERGAQRDRAANGIMQERHGNLGWVEAIRQITGACKEPTEGQCRGRVSSGMRVG